MIAFVRIFYAVDYIQKDIARNRELVEVFKTYSLAYSFSAASTVDSRSSVILLSIYLTIFVPLNVYALKKVWREISSRQ